MRAGQHATSAAALSIIEQAAGKQPWKRRRNNWPKGVSGNPLGKRSVVERQKELQAAIAAKADEIFCDILLEYDGLTGLERTLAKQAAVNLALAHHSLNVEARGRLLGSSTRILDKLRRAVDQRAEAAPMPSLQDLLGRK